MKKPIVFLSHSAKNKKQLVALKSLLNRKAAGFIEFFLSCDGESIRLGTNWVKRLDEALKGAKLMFVFVSRESLQSTWVPFEAGYSYGRAIDVVPCCLPGVDLKDLPAPLSLLQAQPLHSASDLSRLLHKCNEVFQTSISEKIASHEVAEIFKPQIKADKHDLVIAEGDIIKELNIQIIGPPGGLEDFLKLCRRRHLDCFVTPSYGAKWEGVNASGIEMFERAQWYDEQGKVQGGENNLYAIKLAPELRYVTLPLLDAWRKKRKMKDIFKVTVSFLDDVDIESDTHRFTTKLYGSGVSIILENYLSFRKMNFSFNDRTSFWRRSSLTFTCFAKLVNEPLDELIRILVSREILIITKSVQKQLRMKAVGKLSE